MNMAKDGDTIKVVFVYQKNEQVEKVTSDKIRKTNQRKGWIVLTS